MPIFGEQQFMPGATRTALLMEMKDKDGNKQVLIYHLTQPIITLENEWEANFNLFDPRIQMTNYGTKVTIEAYLSDPRNYDGPMPDPDQKEIEHTKAVTDGTPEEEIIYDEHDYDSWDED